jgi:ATP-dependent Clp protease protease subunit
MTEEAENLPRHIYIAGDISLATYKRVAGELDELGDEEPVTLFLSSDGGDPDAALAIFDLLREFDNHVNIHARGYNASAAILVLQAADRRIASTNSFFMLHRGTTNGGGDLSPDERMHQAKADLERFNHVDRLIYDRLKTGRSFAQFKSLMLKSASVSAADALGWGLIDLIAEAKQL